MRANNFIWERESERKRKKETTTKRNQRQLKLESIVYYVIIKKIKYSTMTIEIR